MCRKIRFVINQDIFVEKRHKVTLSITVRINNNSNQAPELEPNILKINAQYIRSYIYLSLIKSLY